MIGGNKLISPDLPITKSTEDKLNRGEFAKSLAKTISQYSCLLYTSDAADE